MDRELIWLPGIILQLLMGGVARAYEPICEHKGVHFGYVLKEHTPGSRRDEIVLRAVNSNDYVVQVEYRLACRSASGGESLSNSVSLYIRARGEMAGELSGLWYLPFEAGESVSDLQLVDVVVNRADRPWGNWLTHSEYPQIEYRLRCGDYHSPRSGYAWFVQFRTAADHPVHFNYGV